MCNYMEWKALRYHSIAEVKDMALMPCYRPSPVGAGFTNDWCIISTSSYLKHPLSEIRLYYLNGSVSGSGIGPRASEARGPVPEL